MIAIITKRPRFYYEAARELKGQDIEFLTLALDEEIPSEVGVVLTSSEERGIIDFPKVVGSHNIKSAVGECLRIESGLEGEFENLILGIDPGPKPGFAVLGDGKVVHAESLGSPEEIYEASKKVLNTYFGTKVIFRVGGGGGVYRERILKIIQQDFDYPVEVVDESCTTPIFRTGASVKDIIAAVNIALERGRFLREKVEVHPTNGEIKNIQRDSRIISGDITITNKLAMRVASGELDLKEAIKIQRKK